MRQVSRSVLVLALAVLGAACSRETPTTSNNAPNKLRRAQGAPPSQTKPHTWTPAEQKIVDNYLTSGPIKRLQLGAGHYNMNGWLNTDIEPESGQVYLDAGAPFPFPDKTFNYIYAEQLIEHLTYQQAQVFVHESFRVLAPGGRIRLATPNLLLLIALFDKDKTPMQKKLLDYQIRANGLPSTPLPETAWFNEVVRSWGHQFIYDPQSLRATLEEGGFKSVTEVKLGVSDAPDLQNIENHWKFGNSGKDIDEATSQYVEATRP